MITISSTSHRRPSHHAGAEAAFYESLRATTVADARDLIVVIRLNLADMTEVLDGKWKALVDEDATVDERAKQVTEEVKRDLETILKEVAAANPDLAELIAEGVKQWADSDLAPTPSTGNTIIDNVIEGNPTHVLLPRADRPAKSEGERPLHLCQRPARGAQNKTDP